MKPIPTAREFVNQQLSEDEKSTLASIMTNFTKLHVEAALNAALESIPCLGSSSDIATYEEVENEVLNAYPLTNIK